MALQGAPPGTFLGDMEFPACLFPPRLGNGLLRRRRGGAEVEDEAGDALRLPYYALEAAPGGKDVGCLIIHLMGGLRGGRTHRDDAFVITDQSTTPQGASTARYGNSRHGIARQGSEKLGTACYGRVWCGPARKGLVRPKTAKLGSAKLVKVQQGMTR